MFKPTRIEATASRRRLLALIPVAALALIVVNVFVNLRATATPPPMSSAPATSAEAVAAAAPVPGSPAVAATTPRELVEMEAAGLVTLARPMPDPQMRPAWQGDAGYHVWGDCTDPLVRQAAPYLCM